MHDFDRERLSQGASHLSLDLTEEQIESFAQYAAILESWNARMNLTRVPAEQTIERHFLDSLLIAKAIDLRAVKTLLDIGSGAGFPGIPLKIVFPHLELCLLDAVKKKLAFLQAVCEKLGLEDVKIVHGRAEDLGRDPRYREHFNVVTARAVAELRVLAELALPFVQLGGAAVFLKGPRVEDEIGAAGHALSVLGASSVAVEYYEAAGIQSSLLRVDKSKATAMIYPRGPKKIADNPL